MKTPQFPPVDLNVFQLDGFLCSSDLVQNITILHRRQGHVNNLKKEQDDILFNLPPDSPQRKIHATLVNSYIGELSAIKSRLKEHSLLLRWSYDQIIIDVLRNEHRELFDKISKRAEEIYISKHNKKNNHGKNEKGR